MHDILGVWCMIYLHAQYTRLDSLVSRHVDYKDFAIYTCKSYRYYALQYGLIKNINIFNTE